VPDDFDSVVAARFKVLDDAPAPDTWSRVQSKVLDQISVQSTEEEATMIELDTPQVNEHRVWPKRVLLAGLLVAAAVVAIVLVAIRKDDPASPADQPFPTVTVPPTTRPQALSGTATNGRFGGERFAPGTYFVDDVGGSPTPRITVILDNGWESFKPGNSVGIYKEGTGTLAFSRPQGVYKDACHWEDGLVEGPLTTLDGLVAAFSEQGGWVDVTPPSDFSVDGYTGKSFQRTAPANYTDCDQRAFYSWTDADLNKYNYLAGDIETLRFLDLNGTVIAIDTVMIPGHYDAIAPAELATIVDSIHIEPT